MAHQEWREGNVAATLALLEGTRADLRGWEWRYVDRLCHTDLLTLKGHKGDLISVSFGPDGSRIVTAGRDGTAKVWDAGSGAEILTLKGWASGPAAVFPNMPSLHVSASFSPDGSRIVTASLDNTAKVWYAQSGREVLALRGHTGWVAAASFSPDGSRIVTAGRDGTAKVWDSRPFKR